MLDKSTDLLRQYLLERRLLNQILPYTLFSNAVPDSKELYQQLAAEFDVRFDAIDAAIDDIDDSTRLTLDDNDSNALPITEFIETLQSLAAECQRQTKQDDDAIEREISGINQLLDQLPTNAINNLDKFELAVTQLEDLLHI